MWCLRAQRGETGNWQNVICAGGKLLTKKLNRKGMQTIAKNQHYFALNLDAPNNQDKGPTRRMVTRLNATFPRRSP